jgi:xanthine dehydrogenase YagR molybdenum-binding subunit
MNAIGAPINRTDAWAKVSGQARYSAEHPVEGLTHAVLVMSTIPSGRVVRIDDTAAREVPGLLLVMTPQNAPRLPRETKDGKIQPPSGRRLTLLQEDEVYYNNQPIAVVVADTLEHARDAAARLRIEYERTPAVLDFDVAKQSLHPPEKVMAEETDTRRGDFHAGLLASSKQVDAVYTTPIEHHNPLETHATIAQWDGDKLTVHDSTQYMKGVQKIVSAIFGIPPDNVTAICPYVGGGFGAKGSAWSHVALTAMAARETGRPVKLSLDRNQMFGPVGQRPNTEQRMRLGAMDDGRMMASSHDTIAYTSTIEDWIEPCGLVTRMMYESPNQATSHRLARMNLGTPTFMRAPGEASGSFALESAMDELAVELGMDPRWRCASGITPSAIRARNCRGRANRCASATRSAPNASAGRRGIPHRARCARATSWSAGAWRPAPTRPTARPPSVRPACSRTARRCSAPAPRTSAPAPIPS